MMRRLLRVALLCAPVAGCFDFLEPDFPEAGAPAVLQLAAFSNEAGNVGVDGLLVPGLAIGGIQRRVVDDTLEVYGLRLAPDSVRRNGTRIYKFSGVLPFSNPLGHPFEAEGPVVEAVTGPPPRVNWFGIRKADPDTIFWTRGTELVLRVQNSPGASSPVPTIRQWFLELRGDSLNFRISSDGVPPAELRIPSAWVPAAGSVMTVVLTYNQSRQLYSPARDYIANIIFGVQLIWIVRVKSQ